MRGHLKVLEARLPRGRARRNLRRAIARRYALGLPAQRFGTGASQESAGAVLWGRARTLALQRCSCWGHSSASQPPLLLLLPLQRWPSPEQHNRSSGV
eukprot:COSAG01_NODE_1050_length_11922_cov_8.014632_9_plen_98_part_00